MDKQVDRSRQTGFGNSPSWTRHPPRSGGSEEAGADFGVEASGTLACQRAEAPKDAAASRSDDAGSEAKERAASHRLASALFR